MQTRSLAISLITEGPFIGIIGALQRTITVAPPLHLWDQQSSASMTEESRVVTAGRRVVAADWPGRSNRSSWRAQTDDRSQDCRPVTCLMDCNYHQVMHFCWNRWYGFYQLNLYHKYHSPVNVGLVICRSRDIWTELGFFGASLSPWGQV